MPTTTHADPQEQLAALPPILARLCENIFGRLSKHDPKAGDKFLSDISKAAADCERKDLSRVVWAFLASELCEMPRRSENLERHIYEVIAGIASLASGAEHGDIEYARFSVACAKLLHAYIASSNVDDVAKDAAYFAAKAGASRATYAEDAAMAAASATECAADAHRQAAVEAAEHAQRRGEHISASSLWLHAKGIDADVAQDQAARLLSSITAA